jgi:hypothetical protein
MRIGVALDEDPGDVSPLLLLDISEEVDARMTTEC